MCCAMLFRNAAVVVCNRRFIWLIIQLVNITECISLEHAILPNYSNGYGSRSQYAFLADSWVSPTLKKTNLDVYKKNKNKLNELTGGNTKADIENYKNGNLINENKSLKYKEAKGNANKYNDKGGHNGQKHAHKSKKKKMGHKKGDKHKKFKTKKGFQDKYHKNENHKVNEFWDNYETYGTLKKFGKKENLKLEGNKKNHKKLTQKEGKSKKENRKKDETQHKSGSKSETGHNKKKNSDSHYNHGSQYHKEKKTKKHHKSKI